MNLRLLFCLGMGLLATYIGVFMLVRQLRAEPRKPLPPQPNFSMQSATVTDPATGEKTTYREITVSTKLAPGSAPPPATP